MLLKRFYNNSNKQEDNKNRRQRFRPEFQGFQAQKTDIHNDAASGGALSLGGSNPVQAVRDRLERAGAGR